MQSDSILGFQLKFAGRAIRHGSSPKPALADEQRYHSLSNLKNRPLQNIFSKPLVGWKLSFATDQSGRVVEPILELSARPLPVKRMGEMLIVILGTVSAES